MKGPSSCLFQRNKSAPSNRTVPDSAGQIPTSKRARVDLPAPLAPMTATASPAWIWKLICFKMAARPPGAAVTTFSKATCPLGAGNDMD